MQQDKGHVNKRSVNKRTNSMSEGGSALEIHVPCLANQAKSKAEMSRYGAVRKRSQEQHVSKIIFETCAPQCNKAKVM